MSNEFVSRGGLFSADRLNPSESFAADGRTFDFNEVSIGGIELGGAVKQPTSRLRCIGDNAIPAEVARNLRAAVALAAQADRSWQVKVRQS